MDEDTKKIVHLMAQQHLIIPREEGWVWKTKILKIELFKKSNLC